MVVCPNCGRENPDGFRFCGFCSTPLEAPGEGEVRKTVTVLFCDVSGSTTMGERLDPETVRRVMRRYFDEMRSVLESHGGTVEKFIGDAVMAVFGVPLVHEDDALRAVRAAVEMRERLVRLNKELERDHGVAIVARTGVNTGEVVTGTDAQTLATGDAVNVAARLEQAAAPSEILIGADTHRLVRDAVEVEPVEPIEAKGKAEPVPAFRLVSVAGAEGLARRFDVPMVGRVGELGTLRDALARVERDRTCALVTVLGPAGVGKSRLIQEFLDRDAATATVLQGRCLPYGEGITYWPILEMLTATAGIDELDEPSEVRSKLVARLGDLPDAPLVAERLAQLLGLAGAAAAPEETHWAVRKLFEAVAADVPLVAVFDDVHWAEPALLDLVEHVADWSREMPILLVCTARPELLDRRPGWSGGKLNASSFLLEPLSEAESAELVANLLDRAELPEDARRRITEAAEGNPLFVEHMVAMLIDDGLLRRVDDRWVVEGDVTAVAPPASIMALLEARLERLSSDERAVIERAAIEGKHFHVGSVRALSDDGVSVHDPLMALVRRDLIRPDRPVVAGDDAFRFRHILVRDAAYRRIPKETRAVFHERHAEWILDVAGDRVAEFEEFVGYHLEQAYRLRSELGPLDPDAVALASLAAEHLVASAGRAAERGDARASSALLTRALDLLPRNHPDRVSHLVDLAVQLSDSQELDRARAAVEEAESLTGEAPDPALDIRARFARLILEAQMEPEGVAQRMKDEAERAIPRLEAIGDHRGLSKAWQMIGEAEIFWAKFGPMVEAFGRAADHAERAGDRLSFARAVQWCMIGAFSGDMPVPEALELVDELAAKVESDQQVTAWHQVARAVLLAMVGRIEEGRELMRRGRGAIQDLGLIVTVGGSAYTAGALEEIAGDPAAAELEYRKGYDVLAALGEKAFLSTVVSALGRLAAHRGALDEAEELAAAGRDAAASDDVLSQALWRLALAVAAARRGEDDRALELAHDARRLAASTDDVSLLASASEDLALIHGLAGRPGDAAEALRDAIDVWERKGATFVVDRLRAQLADLTKA